MSINWGEVFSINYIATHGVKPGRDLPQWLLSVYLDKLLFNYYCSMGRLVMVPMNIVYEICV